MDRNGIYGKNLHELDLAGLGLAELCANVANNHSASSTQTDTAHACMEWIRLGLDHATDGKNEALRKRMLEFLSGVPALMMSGLWTDRLIQSHDADRYDCVCWVRRFLAAYAAPDNRNS